MNNKLLKSIGIFLLSISIILSVSPLYGQNHKKSNMFQTKEFNEFKRKNANPFSTKEKPKIQEVNRYSDKQENPEDGSGSLGVYTTDEFNITKFSKYKVNCGGQFTIYGNLGNRQTENGYKGVALVKDMKFIRFLEHSSWTTTSVKANIPYGMKEGRYYVTIIEKITESPNKYCTNLPMDILQSLKANLHFPRVSGGMTGTRIGLNNKVPTIEKQHIPMMSEYGYVVGRVNLNSGDVTRSTGGKILLPIRNCIQEMYGKDVNAFKIRYYSNDSGSYKLIRSLDVSILANETKYYSTVLEIDNPGQSFSIKTKITDISGKEDNKNDNQTVDVITFTP